jgi:hypothetical protein
MQTSCVASLRQWPKSRALGGRNHVDWPAEISGIRTFRRVAHHGILFQIRCHELLKVLTVSLFEHFPCSTHRLAVAE